MKKIVLNENHESLEVKNPALSFEESEATCSYMLRNRNGLLKGKSYGEALYHSLASRGINQYANILEIGAGSGHLALNFLSALKSKNKDFHYTILDRSPELIRGQKQTLLSHAPKVRWIEGNAKEEKNYETRHPYDLVIANEMIGYLDVQIVALGQEIPFLDEKIAKVVNDYSHRMKIPLLFPMGLIKLLKNLDKKTSSEVTIVLSEYFTKIGGGSVMNQHGQKEFCLNMYFVMDLIRALGFEIESMPMLDFFEFDLNFRPLSKDIVNLITEDFPEIHRQIDPLSKGEKLLGDLKIIEDQDFMISSSEWIGKMANYSFLILKKKKTFEWFGELEHCRAVLSNNVAVIAEGVDHYLIRNSPQILLHISAEDVKFIKLMKKDMPMSEILKMGSKIYAREAKDPYVLQKLQLWFDKGIITLAAS